MQEMKTRKPNFSWPVLVRHFFLQKTMRWHNMSATTSTKKAETIFNLQANLMKMCRKLL